MKPKKSINHFEKRRAGYLKQIAAIGPFVEGFLGRYPQPNSRHVAYRLTFKVKGKTKNVYVPLELVDQTILWTQNHRKLKKLIRAVTKTSLAILHRHVRAKGGVKAKPRRKSRR